MYSFSPQSLKHTILQMSCSNRFTQFAVMIMLVVGLFTTSADAQQVVRIHTSQVPGENQYYQDSEGRWWNKITTITPGNSIANAVDENGKPSGIDCSVVIRFGHVSDNGPQDSLLGYPSSVSKYGLFLNQSDYPRGEMVITGLQPEAAYDFTFYASMREGDPSFPSRSVDVNVQNLKGTLSEVLAVAGPSTLKDEAEVSFKGLIASEHGEISIECSVSPGFQRGNLNAIIITAAQEDKPALPTKIEMEAKQGKGIAK